MFFFEACRGLFGLALAYADEGRIATSCILFRAFRFVGLAISDDFIRCLNDFLR